MHAWGSLNGWDPWVSYAIGHSLVAASKRDRTFRVCVQCSSDPTAAWVPDSEKIGFPGRGGKQAGVCGYGVLESCGSVSFPPKLRADADPRPHLYNPLPPPTTCCWCVGVCGWVGCGWVCAGGPCLSLM